MYDNDDDLFGDNDNRGNNLAALKRPNRNVKYNQANQQNRVEQDLKVSNEDDDDFDYAFPQGKAKKEEPQKLADLLSANDDDTQNSYYSNNKINQRINKPKYPRAAESRHQNQDMNNVLYSSNNGYDNQSNDYGNSDYQRSTQYSDINAGDSQGYDANGFLGKTQAPSTRPGTSTSMNARARLMEQQRAKLANKGPNAEGSLVANQVRPGTRSGNIYQGSTYENQTSMKDQGFYDPSFKSMDTSNLPSLQKQNVMITTKYNVEEAEPVTYTQSRQANHAAPQQEYSSPPQTQQKETYSQQQQQQEAQSEASDSPRELYAPLKDSRNAINNEEEKDMTASELKQEKEVSSDEEPAPEDMKALEKQKKELNKQQDAEIGIVQTNEQVDPQYQSKILNIDIRDIVDMRAFLMSPVPRGYRIECTIKRDRSGFGRLNPKYHCFLSNGRQDLMSAKKRAYNKTSNYLISYSKTEIKKNSSFVLGKLRSNFLGTEFNIFDQGLNPNKSTDIEKLRANLAVVLYESNLLSAKGPRKMKVLIPDVNENTSEIYQFKPLSEREGILSNYKAGKKTGIKEIFNKNPKWNEQLQAFVLNFNGRVEKPSVKNFQLIDERSDDRIFLQFGRVTNDMFNMDFEWPLSPFQAFAICLSSFDYKIACE